MSHLTEEEFSVLLLLCIITLSVCHDTSMLRETERKKVYVLRIFCYKRTDFKFHVTLHTRKYVFIHNRSFRRAGMLMNNYVLYYSLRRSIIMLIIFIGGHSW